MVIKSAYPDNVIPKETLIDYFLKTIAEYPSTKTAIVSAYNGRSYTYKDLVDNVRKCASFLARSGLKKGDVVALCSPNSPEFLFVFLATAACGGIITTCNPLYREYEILQQFEDSKPRFVFTIPEDASKMSAVVKRLSKFKEIIMFGDCSGYRSFQSIIDTDDGSLYPKSVPIDIYKDVLVLPYSSGTTGYPKGVMLSNYNFVSALIISRINWKALVNDVEYLVLPMFHIYGMLRSFTMLEQGATLVLDQRFILKHMAKAIERFKVTSCPLVPPMLLEISKSNIETTYDVSSLKTIVVGAAPIAPELVKVVAKKLQCCIDLAWGMTETTGASVIANRMVWRIYSSSSGLVCPMHYIKICDVETGKELGVHEDGEVLVKGPVVMIGYYHNPEATARTFDKDGFLHTGDIGHHDELNQLYVIDRVKELIKYKGFQVAPAEIEHVLLSHSRIADAAVIGIPDENAGELPKAFIVKRDNSLSSSEVHGYINDLLSAYKRLRGGVEFVDAIPRSASGKILRRLLRGKTQPNHLIDKKPKL